MLSHYATNGKSTVGRDSTKIDAHFSTIHAKSNPPTTSKQISQTQGTLYEKYIFAKIGLKHCR